MKSICLAAIFAVLVAGCTSTSPSASNRAGQPMANYPFDSHLAGGTKPEGSAPKAPRLAVGTRYPDEPLILPWFLDDTIGAVNAH